MPDAGQSSLGAALGFCPKPPAAFPRSGASRPSPSRLRKTVIFVEYGLPSIEGRWRRKRHSSDTESNARTSRLTTCTGSVHPSTLTPAGIFVEPRRRGHGRSKTRRKITRVDLLLGVDLVESIRREVFDEIRLGLFVLFFFLSFSF